MALSAAFVSALRAQFTSDELATMRSTATAQLTLPDIGPSGALAAMPATHLAELAASLRVMQMGNLAELIGIPTSSDSRSRVIASIGSYSLASRRRAAKRAARTRSQQAIASIRSDNPANVRPFDGTMARARHGGIKASTAMPIFSSTYGSKLTERNVKLAGKLRARTFTVELHVRFEPGVTTVLRSYVDEWSADRTGAMSDARKQLALVLVRYTGMPHDIVITESSSEPVAMPEVSASDDDRAFVAAISTSRDSRTASPRELPANPFAGSYDEFIRAVGQALRSAGFQLAGDGAESVASYRNASPAKVARELGDYVRWAGLAASPADQRWYQAQLFLIDLCTALGKASDADAREIAEEMMAGHMAWGLPR